MVIEWTQSREETKADGKPIRAAKYVRMSTEHQEHSTDNQTAAIELYAKQRRFEIVKTYADEGKSGLQLSGRDALKMLLADISEGRADFSALLVYDVSRFGRFQDPDEAATYELLCKRAGIAVHYCAEQFENDGTIGSSIIKTVKRAMAGEYSRELSVKVFAGQSHLISLGFRQGGAAGFGLRRMLVDQSGTPKTELGKGEHKSIATDRVILVPGPRSEIEIVREIYDRFCRDGSTELEIAQLLNSRGILSDLGRHWTRGSIHQILVNEKYIGNNVWGRTAFKLKHHHEDIPQEDWVRANNVFEPIVDQRIFDQAQVTIQTRSQRLSDDEMLKLLRSVYEKNGRLTGLIIDEANDSPSSSAFQSRFGSLLRAYMLVGYAPDHDYRYIKINRSLRRLHPVILQNIVAGIANSGATVTRDPTTDLLHINAELTAAVVISRCKLTTGGFARWKIRLDEALKPDITIAVRMDEENGKPYDYYLLPRLDMREAILRMAEYNGRSLDAYRCETLERFYSLTARARLMRVA